jgi:hypothetical protein
MYRGIRVNPTTLMHEPEERTESFELLACSNILVLPGSAEPAHPINVEVSDKRQPICRGEVAERILWFGTPEEALEFPSRLLTYSMTYASDEDIEIVRKYFSDDDFKAALDNPAHGIFSQSSWTKWNEGYGRIPVPPLPERRIPGACPAKASTFFPAKS